MHPAHEPDPEMAPRHPAIMIGGPLDGQRRRLPTGPYVSAGRPGVEEPPAVWVHTAGADVGRLVDVATSRPLDRRQYRYRRAGQAHGVWRYEFAGLA